LLSWGALGGLGLYGTIALGLWLFQGRYIFFPDRQWKQTPQDWGWSYEDLWIGEEGRRLHGWWIPQDNPQAPVLIYFHGNEGNISHNLHRMAFFRSLGLQIMAVDYRGYGHSSPPFPQEQRLYEDGQAILTYAVVQRQWDPRRVVIYGHSLGGAIALNAVVASRQPWAGLVIEGSFTSLLAMAHHARKFTYLPLGWILHQRFASLEKVPRLQVPVLLVHGTGDRTVPYTMSEELYRAAPNPKVLALIPGVDHDITASPQGEHIQILGDFLQQIGLKTGVIPER